MSGVAAGSPALLGEPLVAAASRGQEGLWFLDEAGQGAAYAVPLPYEIHGPLNPNRLRRSIQVLVDRHETLRTTLAVEDGALVQRIAPRATVRLATEPLAAEAVEDALRDEAARPPRLVGEPLSRWRLFRIGPERHVLSIVLHHGIYDTWSGVVLSRELQQLYAADGDASALPPLAVQYRHFAAWRRQVAAEQEDHAAWWGRTLAGAPASSSVPPDGGTELGAAVRQFAVEPAVAAALSRTLRDERVTPYVAALAAWYALLARRSGARELVVGMPIANRDGGGAEGIVGFLAGTVPLRVALDAGATWGALRRAIADTLLAALDRSAIPFDEIVRRAAPPRTGRPPLFQTMVVGEDDQERALRLEGLVVRPIATPPAHPKFDLLLGVHGAGTVAGGYLEYDTVRYGEQTAKGLLAEWTALLGQSADPAAPVPLTPAPAPAEAANTVETRFVEQARRRPDAPALRAGARVVSYGELDAAAGRLAAALRNHLNGPGSTVLVVMDRSPDAIAACLAALRAGSTYVPLDPAYPLARLRASAAAVRPAVVVASPGRRALAARLAPAPLVVLDDLRVTSTVKPADDGAKAAPAPAAPGRAYVLFTSGSTGLPKGVEVTHEQLLNVVAWEAQAEPEPIVTLQLAPLSFDVSLQEVFSALSTGGVLEVAPESSRRDPDELWDVLERARVARLFLPYVALQALAETATRRATLPADLRRVITAGERLRVTDEIRALFARLGPGAYLENQYGPTETHVVTAHRLTGPPEAWDALPLIGPPLPGVRARVVDAAGEPAADGADGRLLVSTPGLTGGYVGNAHLTAERYSVVEGERWYDTGDVVSWEPGGALHFVGRTDDQLKIRGFRVEPGDVEAALIERDDVLDAVVVAAGSEELWAFVRWADPAAPAQEDARRALAEALPAFMVPARLVAIADFPRLPSGKVDRADLARRAEPEAPVPPTPTDADDDLQQRVLACWQAVLGRTDVDPGVGFFDQGGHSLAAIRLAVALSDALGRKVRVRDVYETPTVCGLADRLSGAGK